MDNILPIKHKHKHYFTTTKTEFEPVNPEKYNEEDLYKRTEYAYMMCNSPCNNVKKIKVVKGMSLEDE